MSNFARLPWQLVPGRITGLMSVLDCDGNYIVEDRVQEVAELVAEAGMPDRPKKKAPIVINRDEGILECPECGGELRAMVAEYHGNMKIDVVDGGRGAWLDGSADIDTSWVGGDQDILWLSCHECGMDYEEFEVVEADIE